ncbi:Adenine/guanine permease AZG1, partial [Tetrabaena socialis]
MAYILAVNGNIVADTGGACTVNDCANNTGVPFCMFMGAPFDLGYLECRERAKRSMVTATAVASFVSCVLMGAFANLPFGIAPGMGINAFFTYTVVGFFGSGGMISYREALAAAFIEGWIFFVISITGLRTKITTIVRSTRLQAADRGGRP